MYQKKYDVPYIYKCGHKILNTVPLLKGVDVYKEKHIDSLCPQCAYRMKYEEYEKEAAALGYSLLVGTEKQKNVGYDYQTRFATKYTLAQSYSKSSC